MSAAFTAIRNRPTETICMLLMGEERGMDVSRLSEHLGMSGERIQSMMASARAGEMVRVPAVAAERAFHPAGTSYAFQPNSMTARAAEELATFGFVSSSRLKELARTTSGSGAELRSRVRTGFGKADIFTEIAPDGGLQLPADMVPLALDLSTRSWRLEEGE